jgi:hypothetical protein
MAEQKMHGATLKLSGPGKPAAPTAPKPRVLYYEVLTSHMDGQTSYKAGMPGKPNFRGIDSPSRAEELGRKGLISLFPTDLNDEGLTPDPGNPNVVESGEPDKAQLALEAARKSTWRPGSTLATPKKKSGGK